MYELLFVEVNRAVRAPLMGNPASRPGVRGEIRAGSERRKAPGRQGLPRREPPTLSTRRATRHTGGPAGMPARGTERSVSISEYYHRNVPKDPSDRLTDNSRSRDRPDFGTGARCRDLPGRIARDGGAGGCREGARQFPLLMIACCISINWTTPLRMSSKLFRVAAWLVPTQPATWGSANSS